MPFIPNYADAAVDPNQAEPDSGDFEILLAGTRGDGVLSGCAVTASAVVFVPSDISGLTVWLKADSLSLSDGDPVTTWTDSSGSGNSPTQATAGNKPAYKTNIVNSKPVVRFGGASDDDSLQVVYGAALSQPNTVYVAVKCTVSQAQAIIDGGGAGGRHLLGDELSTPKFGFYAGSTVIEGATRDTSWHVWAAIFNAASSKLYIDGGAAFATGNPGTNTMSGITLGDNYLQPHTNGFDGDIFEVLVYTGAHTTTQLDQVGGYIATRIATTWTAAT